MLWLASSLLFVSACSDDEGSPADAESELGTNVDPNAPPVELDPSAPLVGAFTVLIRSAQGTDGEAVAAFQGIVRDGPTLDLTTWTQTAEDDRCVLLEPSIPFCDPACGSGQGCITGDVCQAHPEPHSVGVVTVRGLELETGETEFTLTPLRPNFNYLPGASIRLAYPPVAEGDPVELTSEGGEFSPMTVTAQGVAPLEVETNGDALPISNESALSLTWTPPAQGAESSIFIEMDISHHGGAKGKIECETPDDGSLEISQSLVASLIELGYAGFPTIRITRMSVGSANIEAGRVALEVTSDVELPLAIPGLVSCTDASDCESDQVCATDRSCQPE